MTLQRPVIALAVDRRPPGLVALIGALATWTSPRPLGQLEGAVPAAVLASSPDATVPEGLPSALWVSAAPELGSPPAARARVLLAGWPGLAAAADDRMVLVPAGAGGACPPYVAPFVRERLRRARGLPPAAVLEADAAPWRFAGRALPSGDAALADSALACAAAAVVGDPQLLLLAAGWGTPAVTDPDTAAAAGARPDVDVLVEAAPAEQRTAAERVAMDLRVASQLAWSARARFLAAVDVRRAAATVAGRLLHLSDSPDGVRRTLDVALTALPTPPGARLRTRLADALAGLPGSTA